MEVQLRQKKKWRTYLHSKIFLVGLFILVIILAKASFLAHERKSDVTETTSRVTVEEKELLARKSFLESEIAKLKTKEGKESELRKKYGVAKSGEQMAVIVEPEVLAEDIDSSTKKGWVASILGFFKFK